MDNLEITGYCWNDGLPCKGFFCNPKCEKSYKAKEQRILTKDHGKRANYGVKGV